MIQQEMLHNSFIKAPYIFTNNKELAKELYQEAFLRTLENKKSLDAFKNGKLLLFFITTCKYIYLDLIKHEKLFISLDDFNEFNLVRSEEKKVDTYLFRRLENDLIRGENENEIYTKKIIKIVMIEGSIYRAAKVTGIRYETIKKAVNDYITINRGVVNE